MAAPNIALLRKVLLGSLVLGTLALAGLFLFGRAGQKSEKPKNGSGPATEEGVMLIGEGFDFTLTDGNRPVFRIRGESIRADRNGTVFLDGVGVTLYDKDGQPYHVESKEASFNRATSEGKLRGDVYLRGPGDLQIRTPQLQIQNNGNLLVSPRPVQILYAKRYFIRADSMQVYLPDEQFLLNQNVRIQSLPNVTPPLSLFTSRLVYERKQRVARLDGGGQIHHGANQINARRMAAFLTPDETGLTFVRAMWEVAGRIAMADPKGGKLLSFTGNDLAVDLEAGNQPRHVTIDGPPTSPARLQTTGGGITRVLAAPRLEASLVGKGILSAAQGWGGVEMRENAPPPAPGKKAVIRQARGQRADARFRPDGQMAGLNLFERIVYSDGETRAEADRAAIDLDQGRSELFGNPVVVTSPRGDVRAPHAVYTSAGELIQADNGVRTRLEKEAASSLSAGPLGEGDGPIFVESKDALWRREPNSFLFRGAVRAWRGDNILFAGELRGDKAENQVRGSGGVKTLLRPTQEKSGAPKVAAAKGAAKPPGPVEVTAADLLYLEGTKVLTYSGSVRTVQDGRTLLCDKLAVELDADRRAKTMTCTGQVKLSDPLTGRNASGDRAIYRLEERKMEMFGEPVTLLDKGGNQLQGKRLIYSVDDGKVEVKSGVSPAPAGGVVKP
jgi:LPS export ABC transporter protein LptC/lipopolysaccharide transport protein LptA